MKKLGFVIIALLFLAGCGKDELQGNVVDKNVRAGYDFVYMQPITSTSCSGKPVTCRTYQSGVIPIWYHVPACYKVVVKGDHSGDTCVDEGVWNHISIGDYYEGKDVAAKDRKVRK